MTRIHSISFQGKWSTCDKHQTRLDSEPGSVEWVCNHRPIWANNIQVTSVCIIYISAFSWYNSTSSLRSWGVFFTAGLFSSPDPCWSLVIPVGCQATFSERVRLVPVHLCLWSSTIKPQVATKMGPKKSHWAISPSYMGMLQHMLCWEKNNSLIYIYNTGICDDIWW